MKDAWFKENLTGAKATLPLSFTYAGQPSAKWLAEWPMTVAEERLDANRTQRTLTWTDPKTGLEVRCVAVDYADYPAVEWLLYFTNTGKSDSPIIAKIQALDCRVPGAGKGFVLHRALGDSNSAQSFAPVDEPLPPGDLRERVFAPNGGRSSDGNMPYFNVARHDGGMVLAIGWSGQWEAAFQTLADGALRVRAGQQLTHFTLQAGETVRSPRIVLAFWQGAEDLRGNNIFRQLVLKHYLPQKDGQPVFPPICASVGVTAPDGTYEKPHLDAIAPMKERGIEVFWSDMDPQQWYPGGFPSGTGTWEVDKAKYPNGLKPLGEAIRAAGLGYLLWFEPERVAAGTKIAREHPEWVHGGNGGGLFRFDDAAALKWMTELIDSHVTTAQLTWVRWDFNIEPLGYWRRNDAPDRQGITEIRHLEGLYAMWAELQRRHPGLIIDNCASGGRRLDIEASRYGLPLWHSDLQCNGSHPEADQLQNGGLYRWVPLHGCGNFALEPSYAFRSAMTPGNIFCVSSTDPKTEEGMKKSVAIYRKLRPYMLGDFYPLFPHSAVANEYGYQFNRPGQDDGVVLVFRREWSRSDSLVCRLRGLDPAAIYEVTNVDKDGSMMLSGQDLMEKGLTVEIKEHPGAAIVTYRRATLFAHPGELFFAVANRSEQATAKTVRLTYRGEADRHTAFTISAADPWVKILPGAGTGDGQTFSVSVEPGDLPSALHTSKIIVTRRDISEKLVLPVRLRWGAAVPKAITLTPRLARCAPQGELHLSANVADQFGEPFAAPIQWSVSGGGKMDDQGVFRSDGTKGEYVVTATVKGTPAATQCEYADIFGNHDGPTLGVVMQQDGTTLNQYSFGYGSTPEGGGAGPVQLTANEWQHVAVVCDGKDVVIYRNGKEAARGKGENPLTPNPKLNFRLGSGYAYGRFFTGALDDFRIYSRAFSADEAPSLMKDNGNPKP